MKDQRIFFDQIVKKISQYPQIKPGKMMNSSGIKYKDKVIAFFHNDEMIFRLGKDFDPHKFGLREVKLLNPFKNKGPLKGWFVVNRFEKEKWEDLTRKAFEYAKSL